MWISLLTEPFFETCRRTHACEKGKFVAGDLHAEKVGEAGERKGRKRRKKKKGEGKRKDWRQWRPLAATSTPSEENFSAF